jgi:two-component system sensor histidine kinase YesM
LKETFFRNIRFTDKLYVRIAAALFLILIVPFYLMLQSVQNSYRQYIEKELSERTISTIEKSEEEIRAAFQNMAAATNIFSMDDPLIGALKQEDTSWYERTLWFDKVVSKINTTNLFQVRTMHFAMVDRDGQIYIDSTMEGMHFPEEFLLDLIEKGTTREEYLSWSMFSPLPGDGRQDKYVSVYRPLFSEGVTGEYLATLMVCISQSEVGDILSRYRVGEEDFIYLCMEADGEIVFYLDEHRLADPGEIREIMAGIRESDGYEQSVIRDRTYIVSYYRLHQPWGFSGEPMYVLYFTEYTPIVQTFEAFAGRLNMMMLVFLALLILAAAVLAGFLTRPIVRLQRCMELYSEKQEVTGVNLTRRDEIGSLSRTFYEMEKKINELFVRLREETEVRERYRYQALRAQVNPHFLFNTLGTIRWMAVIRHADNITEMLDALGTILRYSMDREGETVRLGEELQMIRKYIFIQNYRYGRECRLKIDVKEELTDCPIIKFILQPVVENAFLHAFREFDGQPQITIDGERNGDELYLRVSDNGKGIEESIRESINDQNGPQRKKVTGIGLTNVNERIRIEYGDGYGIRIRPKAEGGTTVEYRLFIVRGNEDDEKTADCGR